MTAGAPARVVAIDDHAIVLAGLRALIGEMPQLAWAGEARSCDSALALVSDVQPDIAVLDVRLGSDDGIALARQLLVRQPRLRIVFFSAYSGDEEVFRALDSGARGYVLKEFAGSEILTAIDHVRRGLRYVSADVARRLACNGPRITLTAREDMVLRAVGSGLRTKDIADLLDIGPATVRTHVERLFEKFECHDRTRLVAVALARGFLRAEQLIAEDTI